MPSFWNCEPRAFVACCPSFMQLVAVTLSHAWSLFLQNSAALRPPRQPQTLVYLLSERFYFLQGKCCC